MNLEIRSPVAVQGGGGNDIYVINTGSVSVVESAGGGTDLVKTSLSSLTLSSNVEDLIYTGVASFTGTGNGLDNTITGGNGNDTLRGGAGADTLIGGAGTDTASYSNAATGVSLNLSSGTHSGDAEGDVFSSIEAIQGSNFADSFTDSASAIRFSGGAGNDTYFVDFATTVISESSSQGVDTIRTALSSYALGSNIENLVYTGSSSFTGTGNSLDNVITAGSGDDVLNGGAGMDSLFGGSGQDSFVFSSAAATTVSAADTIQDFSQSEGDRIDLSQIATLNFIGTDAFTATSGELRYEFDAGTDTTLVMGDLDGDGTADFQVQLVGSISLSASDFVL